jgi:hypothetical protein
MYSITFKELAEGQLSIKLIQHHDGNETWTDFPADLKTLTPEQEIAVFNSLTGSYERFKNVTKGKKMYDTHAKRIKESIPAIPDWVPKLEKKFNLNVSPIKLKIDKRSDI